MKRLKTNAFNKASAELLLKMLKSAQISKFQCKPYLFNHKNSLDSYLYKYSSPSFPASFSYFFLNAIASHKPLPDNSRSKSKKYAYLEDFTKIEKNSFHKILNKYENLDVKNKLILPCLEHHCSILIKLSNSRFIHDEKNFLEEYIDEMIPGVREYLEEYENWEPTDEEDINGIVRESVSEAIKSVNSKILIESLKNFYPHLEILRKKYMPNFIAPNETFRLPVVNSDEKILFSKDFVKRNLDLNKYDDLILLNVAEDNMQGTINFGDLALIIKFHNKKINEVAFKNGIYALNLNGKISIRRLQFLELPKKTVVHIISDNKKYRDDEIDFFELIPMIYGEVVWRSNNFKDIEFLKHNMSEPNLFLSKEFLETDKKEIA